MNWCDDNEDDLDKIPDDDEENKIMSKLNNSVNQNLSSMKNSYNPYNSDDDENNVITDEVYFFFNFNNI